MSTLNHLRILVTRPLGLEAVLMRSIEDAGGAAVHLPVIEITDPADDSSRQYARDHLYDFDIAIFISPTAVKHTLSYLDIDDSRITLAAIGSRSQAALEAAGHKVGIQPDGHDSESLLALDALQEVANKRIVIFRGEDGRDVLAEELKRRGADVHYAAMYTRVRPATTLTHEFIATLDAITISSNEGLQNLYDIVIDSNVSADTLFSVPVFVPGERARKLANDLGFERIIVADNATDQAMLQALEQQLAPRV